MSALMAVIYTPPWVLVHSTRTVWSPSQSVQTPHKNCTQQGLNQAFNIRTNSSCKMHALPLHHCGLLCLVNLYYICNLWLNWETYLLLFNMGHTSGIEKYKDPL